MKKIPTLFERDWEAQGNPVKDVINPECEWALDPQGSYPTRKYDGTCVMHDGEQWWARREVKPGKQPPPNFRPMEEDLVTGKTMGWEPMEQSGWHKYLLEALEPGGSMQWATGTYELMGPAINGNPEGFSRHVLLRHVVAEVLPLTDRSYEGIRDFLAERPGMEGVVFHGVGENTGKFAKIKAKDFPRG